MFVRGSLTLLWLSGMELLERTGKKKKTDLTRNVCDLQQWNVKLHLREEEVFSKGSIQNRKFAMEIQILFRELGMYNFDDAIRTIKFIFVAGRLLQKNRDSNFFPKRKVHLLIQQLSRLLFWIWIIRF